MERLPVYVYLVFFVAVLATIFFLYKAANKKNILLPVIGGWLLLQALVAISGFYKDTMALPPRLLLAILPSLVFIVLLFNLKKGKAFIDGLDTGWLTLLHTVRVLVELVLFWLCTHRWIPELITFEGRNFDIFSGVTAPFIYYFGYVKKKLSRKFLLAWNIICLALLINVVAHALLSVPTRFQQFAFGQPTRAIVYFPFNWLPSFIVMAVLFAQLVCIRRVMLLQR